MMNSKRDKQFDRLKNSPKFDYYNVGDSDDAAKKFRYYDHSNGTKYDLNDLAASASDRRLATLPEDVRQMVNNRKTSHHWFKMGQTNDFRAIDDAKMTSEDAYNNNKKLIDDFKAPEMSADTMNFLTKLRQEASVNDLQKDVNFQKERQTLLNQQRFNGKTTEIKDRSTDYDYVDSLSRMFANAGQRSAKYRQDAGKYVADTQQAFDDSGVDVNNQKQSMYQKALGQYTQDQKMFNDQLTAVKAGTKANVGRSFMEDISPFLDFAKQGSLEVLKNKSPAPDSIPTYQQQNTGMNYEGDSYAPKPNQNSYKGSFGVGDVDLNYGNANKNRKKYFDQY